MANNFLGELRRNALVMHNGPGSVVDFLADGAAISAVVAGLDEWDRSFPPDGLNNHQRISEPRLEQELSNWNIKGFRLPPVVDEIWQKETKKTDNRTLVAVRFPEWLQCPNCNRLAQAKRWGREPGRAYRYCASCTERAPGQRKIFAVPSRFMMACTKGHLDEFPWHIWVNHESNCENRRNQDAELYLKSKKPGLSGLTLSCPKCNASRSMEGIFGKQMWRTFSCRGRRPWLASPDNEICDKNPRALQRGASNLYFPILDSALSIPPWSDYLQEAIGVHWNLIKGTTSPEDRSAVIRTLLAQGTLKSFMEEEGLSSTELTKQIEDRVIREKNSVNLDTVSNGNSSLRQDEYRQYVATGLRVNKDLPNFEVVQESVPNNLRPYFNCIVRVKRLREVRVLKSFTRINPPNRNSKDTHFAQISANRLNWLPAIEVRGEGIFLDFNKETLDQWKSKSSVGQRAEEVNKVWLSESQGDGEASPRQVTPVLLLIHTFAHALMYQMALGCGYPTAALRERLYVSDEDDDMTGVLIYTATSDSGGALGGLQRQGKSRHIERAINNTIQSMKWCSSDPLCIEGFITGPEKTSLAACHACVLAPETTCELYNRFLDRALLVGLPDASEVGFFSPLIRDE